MDIVSACPLRVASLLWQRRPGAWVLTLVCKATYRLEAGVSPLAAEQEHPNQEDKHWDGDPRKSVYASADLVPFKPHADVLLVGSSFATGGNPVTSLVARLNVASIDKSIAVHGDRIWTPDGRVRDPATFARMPLRYERAAGGPDTENPVGVRSDITGPAGEGLLPNLWAPGRLPRERGETIEPVGFGPLAATWPGRRARLGALARSFTFRSLSHAVLSTEVDPCFFNSAPPDQQTAELRGDEQIVLENLHVRHSHFTTRLPGVAPRAIVERATGPHPISFRADTLWIDTDRGLLTLTWRAQLQLAGADEQGRVIVSMARGDESIAWSELAKHVPPKGVQGPAPSPNEEDAAESLSDDDVYPAIDTILPIGAEPGTATAALDSVLPWTGQAKSDSDASSTLLLSNAPLVLVPPLPFPLIDGAMHPDVLRPAKQGAVAGRGKGELPAEWGTRSPESASEPVPPPVVLRPVLFVEDSHPPRFNPAKEVAVTPALAMATSTDSGAVSLGVQGLSDAAAGANRELQRIAEEVSAGAKAKTRGADVHNRRGEILKLLWFDPSVVEKLHKRPEWESMLAEMEWRLFKDHDDDSEENAGAADSRARAAVLEVMSRGVPRPADSLRYVLGESVDDNGAFQPPLVLLAGELEFPFDEIETLKAAITVLTPLSLVDKKLKEPLDAANEFLKIPGADRFGVLAAALTDRLREAFALARRSIPADYLDSNTDRALLKQRAYSMKALYGKQWIRSLLRGVAVNARGNDAAPPVYLPIALKDKLPAYKHLMVKAIGEIDLQEDQDEAAGWAVKVAALARVATGI